MKDEVCAVKSLHHGVRVTDGAGVRLNRLIGFHELDMIDPFVLLDEFRSDNPADYIAGFPMHPHRGIETVTYMIKGSFRHRDSRGGGGVLTDGCTQWMTAGRGIQHSEMPEATTGGLWGYQLWINLPRKHKMVEPRYQHLAPSDVPVVESEGVKVKILSGSYNGVSGGASNYVDTHYLDVALAPGAKFAFSPDSGMSAFFYVHTGSVEVCSRQVERGALAILHEGARVEIAAQGGEAGFIFLAGRPNDEPVARGGPFVMNTPEEIEKAFEDYQNGKLF